jgi:two-component system, NarL family, nitrate/nitrite response regulator NarL
MRRRIADSCEICAEAEDTPAAIEAALRERPDVCLLDAALPGDAIIATAEITSNLPDTAVVVLGDPPIDADLFAALDAGATGYLLKRADTARLAITLRRAAEGEAVLPRSLAARLIERFREHEHLRRTPGLRELTNRELEVLDLLRQGLSTAEIAERLYVARVTVRSHIASGLRKLHTHDRAAALRLLRLRDESRRRR